MNLASARLGGRGLRVRTRTGIGGPEDARRALAALAFPLSLRHGPTLIAQVRRTGDRDRDDPAHPLETP